MDFGNVTLGQLSKIIERNNYKADKLGLVLSWRSIQPGTVLATIKGKSGEGRLVDSKEFPVDKDFHFIIAEIQYWFALEIKRAEDLLY